MSRPSPRRTTATTDVPAAGASAPLRVLVVDDDDLVRDAVRRMLLRLGHQAWTEASGAEAVARLDASGAGSLDLALVDVVMPGIDGLETLRRLRALDPELPVVLISGYPMQLAPATLEELGVAAFLPKPFDLAELSRTLQLAVVAREPARA